MKMRQRKMFSAPAPKPNIPLLVNEIFTRHARQVYLAQRRIEADLFELIIDEFIDALKGFNKALEADIERMKAARP